MPELPGTGSDAFGGEKGLPDAGCIGHSIFDGSFPLPTLVIRERALVANLASFASFCSRYGLLAAPHAKTTMSPELVRVQLDAGTWGMTAATAWQASRIAGMGATRIILANEVVDPGSLSLLGSTLALHQELVLWCYADSLDSLAALESIAAVSDGRLGVLVELGVTGGRTGIRDDDAARALCRRVASGPLPLAGVGGFEGVISRPGTASTIDAVDEFVMRLADLALAASAESLVADDPPGGLSIVTVGGSAYPDRVAIVLGRALAGSAYSAVVRSGCYLTHDDGAYDASSPFGREPREPEALEASLELWASVLSRPEPTRAIVGFGRRDASYDAGLPTVRAMRAGSAVIGYPHPVVPAVVALNDQHAFLDVDADDPLSVGQLLGFGISHPCTTFDKWRAIPLVDDDYRVTRVVRTEF